MGGPIEGTAHDKGYRRLSSLQAVKSHVESEFRDHRRAAPVGVQTRGIVGRDRVRVEGSRLRACPDRTLGWCQGCVPIANVQGKYLPRETDTHVPCRVIHILQASRERGCSIEGVAVADELLAYLARHVPANRVPKLPGRRELQGAGYVVALRPEVKEVWRVIVISPQSPLRIDGPKDLCVDLPEVPVLLRHIAIRQSRVTPRVQLECAWKWRVKALATGIVVIPIAEIERERAQGWAHAAVEVDFGRSAIRELDALAGNAT